MNDFNELMRQVGQMQEQFQKARQELAKVVVEGESGAGMIRVRMNGRHDVVEVKLNDALLGEEREVIEDLIAAAVNDAVRKLEETSKGTLGDMAGGFKLPEGFRFPFQNDS